MGFFSLYICMVTLIPNSNANQEFYITPRVGNFDKVLVYDSNLVLVDLSFTYVTYNNYIKVIVNHEFQANKNYVLVVVDSNSEVLYKTVLSTWESGKILKNEYATI